MLIFLFCPENPRFKYTCIANICEYAIKGKLSYYKNVIHFLNVSDLFYYTE